MAQKETLDNSEIKAALLTACREQSPVVGTFLVRGKWRLLDLKVCGCSDDFIEFCSEGPCDQLQQQHPIGICIHLGHFKYLFDSTVQMIQSEGTKCRISLQYPDKIERLERRVYHRQPVPEKMKVKIQFWHRGYLDESKNEPTEKYWQGILLNLSAGGARFEIEHKHKEYFRVGQILGMQFTPMSYQQPLLLESYVIYAEEQSDHKHFRIGVKFLGLEVSPEGRQVLDRILEIINEYEKMNTP